MNEEKIKFDLAKKTHKLNFFLPKFGCTQSYISNCVYIKNKKNKK